MIKPAGVVFFEDLHAYMVCSRMREDERRQLLALTATKEYETNRAARTFINYKGPKFTLVDGDENPVMIGGYTPVIDDVWQSWMVGTEEGWALHWRGITKAARWMIDEMFKAGARRLQTNTLADRKDAIRWFTDSLHMQPEGVWVEFGAGGEDVACFALTRSAYHVRRKL